MQKITFDKSKQALSLRIGTSTLNNTSKVKDLGVFITDDLKWYHHIQTIKTSTMQKCYQILRSFNSKNIWILLKSYLTYVRPILEYASEIWNPYLIKDIDAIEAVQRYFTRRIFRRSNLPFSSYAERLHMLNLHSLEYRRLLTDLIMVFKITHNLVDVEFEDFFTYYYSPYTTRRHKYCLAVEKHKTNSRSNFFTARIAPIWNKLPANIFSPDNLSSFSSKLKKLDLHQFSHIRF